MLWMALKAFAPGKLPFPLMHVDTTVEVPGNVRLPADWLEKEYDLDLKIHDEPGRRRRGRQSILRRLGQAHRHHEDPGP